MKKLKQKSLCLSDLQKLFYVKDGVLFHRSRNPSDFNPVGRSQTNASLCKIWNKRFAEKPAGTVNPKDGHARVFISGKGYSVSRVTFCLHHGRDIAEGHFIHHKNGNKNDNRPENLEEILLSQAHKRKNKGRGVFLDTRTGKYYIKIVIGPILTLEGAKEIQQALRENYGYHENHGK